MTRKIIPPSVKDEGGFFTNNPELKTVNETKVKLSIDALLEQGLLAIQRVMGTVLKEAASGCPTREAVMNLKDCMTMLHELKKKEQDLLSNLNDEELAAYLKAQSNEA